MLADQKTEDDLAKTSVISEGRGTQKLEPSCSKLHIVVESTNLLIRS